MTDILEQIRQEIARRELSQYRIAKDTGLPQGMLSEFLSGKRTPGGDYVAKLCSYLGLELAAKIPRKKSGKKSRKRSQDS